MAHPADKEWVEQVKAEYRENGFLHDGKPPIQGSIARRIRGRAYLLAYALSRNSLCWGRLTAEGSFHSVWFGLAHNVFMCDLTGAMHMYTLHLGPLTITFGKD
ncbi:hypothetical protein RG2014_062 [Delftia phage RG-2014]|uniref:Uncharacterized protein n=1 Tax=Delftia phage RG-2014 TaxID=1563661 RepID=A0A097PBD9_9CAUD|nr:hypothetical protein RG2014_062 [Delftia phage RG-2014]AIU44316.1 hypothetical protein RG2014_062 [Delftia phage RG-2014]